MINNCINESLHITPQHWHVHALSHFYIDDKFWYDLKMRWLFPCKFSQLFPTQNAAPSTRHGDCPQHSTSAAPCWTSPGASAPTPSCSPWRACCSARGPGAAPWPPVLGAAAARPRPRRRAPPAPGRASAVDRDGSRTVPTAPWRREGTFLTLWFHGSKSLDPNIFWVVAIGYTYWCYLMLVVNTVAYCNLQLSLCGFLASLGANLWWQDNTVLDSTIHVYFLLMCWSLWRDWGPHRLSAKSASWCSGPNLSAVASARHRSLGPWGCLSHGGAVANHVTNCCWSTWKTNQFQENCKVRKMAKVWDSFQLQSEAPWLLGCNPWPLLQITREGGGGRFFKLADVCPTWSGKIQVNL